MFKMDGIVKIIKKWGNSMIITISKEEMKIHNLKEGDPIYVSISKIQEYERRSEPQ